MKNLSLLLISSWSLASSIFATPTALPRTIRLSGRGAKRTRASRNTPQLQSVDVRLTDWISNTDLQWYSTIQVGTPPQSFTVLYDTGSTALVLPRKGCTTCGKHTRFDPAKSRTFSPLLGENVVHDFSTGATTVPISVSEAVNCTFVTDEVSLHGLAAPSQLFALCNQYPETFEQVPMDGILGIGVAPLSIDDGAPTFWSLYYSGQLPEPLFSFYLAPGLVEGAEITLGGIDHTRYTGDISNVSLNKPVSSATEAYVVDLPSFYINGKSALSCGNYSSGIIGGRPAPFAPGIAALDTGTAFLQTPDKQSAEDIYSQISPHIRQIDPAGAWGAPCIVLDAVAPVLTFTIGQGSERLNLTLPRRFFNLGEYPGLPGICQAVFNNPVEPIQNPYGSGPVWLLGSPLLKAYYTIWDGLNLKIGFAESAGRFEY